MDLDGVVRKTWIDSLQSLENDQKFNTFGHFEEGSISTSTADGRKPYSNGSQRLNPGNIPV